MKRGTGSSFELVNLVLEKFANRGGKAQWEIEVSPKEYDSRYKTRAITFLRK